MTDLRLEF